MVVFSTRMRVAALLGLLNALGAASTRSTWGQVINARPLNTGTAAPADVTGVVLDARNRAPIARALVRLADRSVLTDHDGLFHFPEVTSTSVSLTPSKPGFYASAEGDPGPSRTVRLPSPAPIELLLYPEAILVGTAAASTGEGLPDLSVTALRSVFDEYGHHWFPAGEAQTDHEGGFRIPLPAGIYAIRATQRGRVGEDADIVLPVSMPPNTSLIADAIHLLPGAEERLELRPEVRRSYVVHVNVEAEGRGFPTLTARTLAGLTLPLNPMPFRDQSDLRVALPRGNYLLKGSLQNQEGFFEAETAVTVTDREVTGIALHFTRGASLPLIVEADSSANLANNARLPTPAQLGVWMQASADSIDGDLQLFHVSQQQRNTAPSFALPAGLYHLRGQAGGQWYVTAASCGGVDLLTQDLSVSAALSGNDIRVRISNNTATLSGKATLRGEPGAAWIYLLPTAPSATPVLIVRANADGSFFRPYLPPGSYRVLAVERKLNEDMTSSATQGHFLDRLQTFTVTPGEQRTLALDTVPEQNLSP